MQSSVTDQLVFVSDVTQTLNLVQATLEARESEVTLNFIAKATGRASRANMKKIGVGMYSIGKTRMITHTADESVVIKQEVFGRAFHEGTLYYSQEHSICRFVTVTTHPNLD